MTDHPPDATTESDVLEEVDPSGEAGHEHAHGDDRMRPIEEVRRSILSQIHTIEAFELPIGEAYGCVLAADLTAQTDLPPFASSAMDGFAVRASDIADASIDEPASLRIVGRALVGRPPDATVGGGEAVRIATGAPVPAGADCI